MSIDLNVRACMYCSAKGDEKHCKGCPELLEGVTFDNAVSQYFAGYNAAMSAGDDSPASDADPAFKLGYEQQRQDGLAMTLFIEDVVH